MKTSLGGYSSLQHYRLNKRLARRGGIKRGGTTRCRFKGRLEEGEIEIPLLEVPSLATFLAQQESSIKDRSKSIFFTRDDLIRLGNNVPWLLIIPALPSHLPSREPPNLTPCGSGSPSPPGKALVCAIPFGFMLKVTSKQKSHLHFVKVAFVWFFG